MKRTSGQQAKLLGSFFVISMSMLANSAMAGDRYDVNSPYDTQDASPGDRVCADSNGRCTLRAAIEEANVNNDRAFVMLQNGIYELLNGPLVLTADMYIQGVPGQDSIISAGGRSRVIEVRGTGYPWIDDIKIQGGKVDSFAEPGAGILVDKNASLRLNNSYVQYNESTGQGAGIGNQGTLRIVSSVIRFNKVPIDVGGGVTYSGGGICNFIGADLKIEQSSIVSNEATRGGGIRNFGGRMEIVNSTIAFNKAGRRGGGIMTYGPTTINYSTISQNVSGMGPAGSEGAQGGGIYFDGAGGGNLEIANSIIADNRNEYAFPDEVSPDCFNSGQGNILSYRGNLIGNLTENCTWLDANFNGYQYDLFATGYDKLDPKLNYGDYRFELRMDSPAINVINKESGFTSDLRFRCPDVDQKGEPRDDGQCNIGATEYSAPVINEPTPNSSPYLAISNGLYVIRSGYSGKCLDVKDHSLDNSARLQQWSCTNEAHQKFFVTDVGNGLYTIKGRDSGRCVSAQEVKYEDGTPVIQWDCANGPDQLVRIVPSNAGSHQVRFSHSDKCMDVDGPSNEDGRLVQQWQCVGGANQDWIFERTN